MALKSNPSRFAFLLDDAPDLFESGKKKKATVVIEPEKKSDPSAPKKTNKKKKPAATNKPSNPPASRNDQKELLSMAFGVGSKKKAKGNVENKGANPLGGNSNQGKEGNSTDIQQYEEWRQRDLEFVTGTFESDMEAALLQSKLDFKKEKLRNDVTEPKKTKKKGITLSLSQFNAALATDSSAVFSHPPETSVPDWKSGGDANADLLPEEELEKLRLEAQLELKRELEIEMNRDLLFSRKYDVPDPVIASNPTSAIDDARYLKILEEKEAEITQLKAQKEEWEKECQKHKERLKRVMTLIDEAKLKDKVILLAENENLKKSQQQLTEEISSLHSQLEQERSKAHVAAIEYKKLEQSRRRTTSINDAN